MTLSARVLLSAAAAAAVAASAPAAASAAPVPANNACTNDGQWGTLPLELSATATPNGRSLDVSAIQPSVTIPSWLPAKLDQFGLPLAIATGGPGGKNVAVDAWMAVVGTGSSDAPKVLKTTGTLKFTLTSSFKVTNPSLTLKPTDASSWRAADAGGPLTVAQGPAGSLPSIPGGAGNASVQPKGSLWVRATLAGQSLSIDCQPGTTPDPQALTSTYTAEPAPVLVSSVFDAAPVAPQSPAPVTTTTPVATTPPVPAPVGPLAITSPSLKFGSAAVLVSVSCPSGGKDCTGSAVITSAKKLKVGKGAAKLRKLASGAYAVKAGATAPVKLKLTADGKKLKKKALVVDVALTPASGAAVKKRLRAN